MTSYLGDDNTEILLKWRDKKEVLWNKYNLWILYVFILLVIQT